MFSKYLRFRLSLSWSLNGWMAIRRQNSHRTRMHFSSMRTARLLTVCRDSSICREGRGCGRACQVHPLPCTWPPHTPSHACSPAMHTPRPCTHSPSHTCPPGMHAPQPCMPPRHVPPSHACPQPCTPGGHTCPPATHIPPPHTPPGHICPPVDRITDACENITLPQLRAGGNYHSSGHKIWIKLVKWPNYNSEKTHWTNFCWTAK